MLITMLNPRYRNGLLAIAFLLICLNTIGQTPTREELANDPDLFLKLAEEKLEWDIPEEPTKIAHNIYFVGTKGLSSWLITGSQGHILLNSTMPAGAKLIEANIKKLGFKMTDIKILLAGHAHMDHTGGHAYLQKQSSAKMYMMAEDAPLMENGGKTDFHYSQHPNFYFEPVKVDHILRDGEEIKLGDLLLTAIHTPGHTRGSTTFVMQTVENGQVYKVVFPEGTSINPGYRVMINQSYPGIDEDYRYTIYKLETLHPDIWLASHTDMFGYREKKQKAITMGIAAWVDPLGYQLYMNKVRGIYDDEVKAELKANSNQ